MGGINYSDDNGKVTIRTNRDGFPMWEYKSLLMTDTDLKQEGDAGWELVSIVPHENSWRVKAFIFKRPNLTAF
jgi:hypothetical protein